MALIANQKCTGSSPVAGFMRMKIAIYDKKKKIGYACIKNVVNEYIAVISETSYGASVFTDDYSLSRGLKIARKSFPTKDLDVECK